MTRQIFHTTHDGIERVVYVPTNRRFQTPILMQHGMWHGAWCWQHWQELLAEWGWETHAYSLPGHGESPTQRPIRWCTLDYYLTFLQAEVDRLPRRPVLMGHSMGGALTQRYLKYVADDLPAAALIAPWPSHSMALSILNQFLLDFVGAVLSLVSLTTTPCVRNPRRATRMFITEGAIYSPEDLHARLGPESLLILLQYNPPFWRPPEQIRTPMLWLAAEADTLISEPRQRRSAKHYKADYVVVAGAGHDVMVERGYRQTAKLIHNWLVQQGIE